MNLIDRIKELHECGDLVATSAEIAELLDILSEIHPGDADEIDYAIQELSRLLGPDNAAETVEVLRRCLSMAQRMEAS